MTSVSGSIFRVVKDKSFTVKESPSDNSIDSHPMTLAAPMRPIASPYIIPDPDVPLIHVIFSTDSMTGLESGQ